MTEVRMLFKTKLILCFVILCAVLLQMKLISLFCIPLLMIPSSIFKDSNGELQTLPSRITLASSPLFYLWIIQDNLPISG